MYCRRRCTSSTLRRALHQLETAFGKTVDRTVKVSGKRGDALPRSLYITDDIQR